MHKLLIEMIWKINDNYLFFMLEELINRKKIPLKIFYEQLHYSSPAITPSLFHIDPKLSIEGHFFDAILQTALLTEQYTP